MENAFPGVPHTHRDAKGFSKHFVLLVLVPGGGYVKRFNYICMLKLQLTQASPGAQSQLCPFEPWITLENPRITQHPNPPEFALPLKHFVASNAFEL